MQMPHSEYARARLWGCEVPNSGQVFDIGSQGYARTRAHTHANHQRARARAYWGKIPQIQQNSACTTEEKL